MAADELDNDRTRSVKVLAVGTEVSHYKVIERIGAGGMGEVYLAEDTRLKRRIAIKFLQSRFAADKELKARFIREAQAAAALKHRNIVTIHEVAEYGDRPYIVMEHVEGESLDELIRRNRLNPAKSLGIMSQLCEGLREAHEAGIVHRDIKPSNIIVDKKGCCRILDFGLAKGGGDSQSTSPGTIIGTAGYMSPEQGQGLKVDHGSDIFSLGIVFYEMLTGRSPFKRANIPATIHAVVHEQPEKIAGCFDFDTERWQQILDKMLTKTPADRYQSIGQVAADISRLKDGESLPWVPTGREPATPPAVKSLAVLYLRNLGPADDEYLSHGITEDLIVDLTRIGSIRVAPMRSVLKFKDSDRELVDIAGALDVSLLLDGSIHKTESKVRVSAQLIDVASGKHLWADRWEDSLDRLHLVKTALAEGVSTVLKVDSSVVRAAQVGEPEARSPKAYEYYLRGKYTYEHRHSPSDVSVASKLYEQALKLEPSLLAARAGSAEIMMFEDRYEEAVQELLSAMVEAQEGKQQADEAHILRLLARCFSGQSLWDEAAHFAEQAVQVSKQLGDLAGEAASLSVLIKTRQRRAMFDDALKLADRVLEINRQLADRDKEAEALNLIGTVHLHKGDCENSLAMHERALEIARERDQGSVEANCIGNIGAVYFYLGDLEKALSHWKRSLQKFSILGNLSKKAATMQNIAAVHVLRGDYHKALDLYEQAQSIHAKCSERDRCALTINNAAFVLIVLGRYDEAIAKLTSALETADDLGYPFLAVLANTNLGFVYFCQGEIESAAQRYQTAIDMARRSDLRRDEAVALSYAGEMYYLNNQSEKSYDYFEKAQKIAEKVRDKETLLRCSAYLATSPTSGTYSPTRINHQRAIVEDAEKLGDPRMILIARRLLGESIARSDSSDTGRRNGTVMLRELLTFAQTKEITYEVAWIESILNNLADSS